METQQMKMIFVLEIHIPNRKAIRMKNCWNLVKNNSKTKNEKFGKVTSKELTATDIKPNELKK